MLNVLIFIARAAMDRQDLGTAALCSALLVLDWEKTIISLRMGSDETPIIRIVYPDRDDSRTLFLFVGKPSKWGNQTVANWLAIPANEFRGEFAVRLALASIAKMERSGYHLWRKEHPRKDELRLGENLPSLDLYSSIRSEHIQRVLSSESASLAIAKLADMRAKLTR